MSYWPAALSLAAMLLLWIIVRKGSAFWVASSLLSVYLIFAGIGVVMKGPLIPIVAGCIAAVVWWDLMDFGESLHDAKPQGMGASLEKLHLEALAIMVGTCLLVEAAGLWLRVQLPFGAIAILVLLACGCILYAVHRLRNA